MDRKEFTLAMAHALQQRLEDVEVTPQAVRKNNGVVLQGLLFRRERQKSAPTIYLEPYYERIQRGEAFADAVEEVLSCYESCSRKGEFQADFFLKYEEVRKTLVYKLVNYQKNKKLLEEIPHLPYLDLAMVFYSMFDHPQVGPATVLIRNSHLELWKINQRILYAEARKNTPRLLPAELRSMSQALEDVVPASHKLCTDLHVLTNKAHTNGAASLLYPGMLKSCGEMCKGDFFLLPSSIHEVILLPYERDIEPDSLRIMVKEINEAHVQPQEVLSDSVYFYSREKEKLLVL